MPPFDFKKEFKELYKPTKKPLVVEPSDSSFLAVRGEGDPNDPDGNFKENVGALYSVAYAIKMSKMGARRGRQKKEDRRLKGRNRDDRRRALHPRNDIGPYDAEPETLESLRLYAQENALLFDFSPTRLHHEIYLSDPNRCEPEKLKTLLRLPARRLER